jgi:cystathionine gamma-synthase
MGPKPQIQNIETLLAQAGHYIDASTGAVVPPINTSTTYARNSRYEPVVDGLTYSRDKNPIYNQVEEVLQQLESGSDALIFSSGLAAATAVFKSLAPGDHVVAPTIMYHGLRDWLDQFCANWGLKLDYFDASKEGALEQAVRPGKTRIVWIETPANPSWVITDIRQAADIAHAAGAYLAMDATVSTPILTRPIEYGADIVFHSASKYLNGHSDVIAGALICREDNELWQSIRFQRKHEGGVLGPFEAWLMLRGMRTMHLRVQRACESASKIAIHFNNHPAVNKVLYPGLENFPGHDIAARQMQGGFGGVLSLLVNGDAKYTRQVASRTKLFVPGTSLGGVESLIEHRATVEGPKSPIPKNLLRLSVGIEAADDLITDVEQALTL